MIVPATASTGPISVSNANGTVTSEDSFIVGSFFDPYFPQPINLSANESRSFSFAGEQGRGYMLGLTDVVTTTGSITVVVKKPDATNLTTCSSIKKTASCTIPYLPITGNYTVIITAVSASASLSVSLNRDINGTLTTSVSETFIADKVGQAGTYDFEAAAGMLGRLYLLGNTILGNTTVQLYRPDGVLHQSKTVNSVAGSEGSTTLDFVNLPADGTYRVRLIPPSGNAMGGMQVTLVQDISDITIINGSDQSVSLNATQSAYFTFAGTAGQWLGLGLEDLEVTPSNGSLSVTVLKPDGSQLGNFTARSPSSGYALPKLPVTGAYKVQIAAGTNTASFKLLLTEDEGGVLQNNGVKTFAGSDWSDGELYIQRVGRTRYCAIAEQRPVPGRDVYVCLQAGWGASEADQPYLLRQQWGWSIDLTDAEQPSGDGNLYGAGCADRRAIGFSQNRVCRKRRQPIIGRRCSKCEPIRRRRVQL